MDVAIYLRKSRADDPTEDVNRILARHMSMLSDIVAECNYNVIKTYQEIVSGESLFTRPQMLQLLEDAQCGAYDGILCMDIDRLSRGTQKDRGIIFDVLKDSDTKIITPQKTYDLSNDTDEMMTEIQGFVARQELKNIVKRMRRGMIKAAEEGCHITDIPYGYKRAKIGKKSTLIPDEEQSKVVNMIFDMYVNQRIGMYTIADKLNRMGYRTRHDKSWQRSSISVILRNHVYIGKIEYNKTKRIKQGNGGGQHIKRLPKEKWIVSNGMHPQIVNEDIFAKAQEILAENMRPPTNIGILKNPLSGLIICSNCGSKLSRQKSKNESEARLRCLTPGCCKSAFVTRIEASVLGFLQDAELQYRSNATIEKKEEIIDISDTLNRELNTAKQQKNKLYDFLERGIYSETEYKQRSKELNARIKQLDAELAVNEKKQISKDDMHIRILKVLNEYQNADAAERNELLKSVISKIFYSHPKGEAKFKLQIILKYKV